MAPLMMSSTISKQEPILVAPAEPTPNETKLLSDIDDQLGLRFYMGGLYMFADSPSMEGRDPVSVIRDALAKALVFYYPLAGRIAQAPDGKLAVDCTGEGVLLTAADADVRLDQFGEPSFPSPEELVPDVHDSSEAGGIGRPVLFMQVTRLRCGGFVIGNRIHHSACDGAGMAQFLGAVGEMARGAAAPSVLPAWSRELLTARTPPVVVTHLHREYEEVLDISSSSESSGPMVNRSFFFSASDIAALRRKLPDELHVASVFDVITACAWRCRTAALRLHPEQEVRAHFAVSTLRMLKPQLPAGYYGNTFATPVAVSAAGELCGRPLGYAVELVRGAKREVTAEYIQSVADLMAVRGRPHFVTTHTFLVSDITRIGFNGADFGWGPATFIGTAAGEQAEPSYYTRVRGGKGGGGEEDGISVSVSLPDSVMARFAAEVEMSKMGSQRT